MTTSPNPTADAEEDLRKLLTEFGKREVQYESLDNPVEVCASNEEIQVVLDYITSNFVPREQVEQIIGKDALEFHDADCRFYKNNCYCPARDEFLANKLRAEQRKQLHPNQSASKENTMDTKYVRDKAAEKALGLPEKGQEDE